MSRITENQLTKLYYSIDEVADMFEVNTSLIRFWEKEFPTIQPKKNKKGNRLFTPKEIAKIDRIYVLVKEQGYTLDGAKKALRKKSEPMVDVDGGDEEVINKLRELRSKLLDLKEN